MEEEAPSDDCATVVGGHYGSISSLAYRRIVARLLLTPFFMSSSSSIKASPGLDCLFVLSLLTTFFSTNPVGGMGRGGVGLVGCCSTGFMFTAGCLWWIVRVEGIRKGALSTVRKDRQRTGGACAKKTFYVQECWSRTDGSMGGMPVVVRCSVCTAVRTADCHNLTLGSRAKCYTYVRGGQEVWR